MDFLMCSAVDMLACSLLFSDFCERLGGVGGELGNTEKIQI